MPSVSLKSSSTIASARTVIRITQYSTFMAAIILFPMCILAAIKFATSPFEIFLGVVMGGILSIAMIILGLVLPLAMAQPNETVFSKS